MGSVLDSIGERVANLERNLESLESEQLALREEIARLREENVGLRAANARLRDDAETSRRDALPSRERLTELEQEKLSLQQRVDALSGELADQRDATVRARANASALEQHLVEFRQRLRSLFDAAEPGRLAEVTDGPELEPAEGHHQADAPAPVRDLPTSSSQDAMDTIHELVAYPFARFAAQRAFQNAVRELQGTRDVRLRHYDHGTLQLRIDYVDDVPLAERLLGLPDFPGAVIEDGPRRLELRLADQDARQ